MAEQKLSRLPETKESDQWHEKITTKSQELVQFIYSWSSPPQGLRKNGDH